MAPPSVGGQVEWEAPASEPEGQSWVAGEAFSWDSQGGVGGAWGLSLTCGTGHSTFLAV